MQYNMHFGNKITYLLPLLESRWSNSVVLSTEGRDGVSEHRQEDVKA